MQQPSYFKSYKALCFFALLFSLITSCTDEDPVTKESEQEPDTWIVLANLDQELNKVQFISDEIGFVLGETSIFKTTDGGKNWSELPNPSGTSAPIVDMHAIDQNTIVALVGPEDNREWANTTCYLSKITMVDSLVFQQRIFLK
jgi:hypothetical protein